MAKKASLVLLTGRLRQEQWIDKKSKSKRSRVKIMALLSPAFLTDVFHTPVSSENWPGAHSLAMPASITALHVEAKYAGKKADREPGEEDVPY